MTSGLKPFVWSFALLFAVITICCSVAVYLVEPQTDFPLAFYIAWPGAVIAWLAVGDGERFEILAVVIGIVFNAFVGAAIGALVGFAFGRRER